VRCYNPANRHERTATCSEENPEGRWRRYGREELLGRDKASLDLFWLKDKSLTDLDNLPEPDELAEEIIENLEAGLESLRSVLLALRAGLQQSAGVLSLAAWKTTLITECLNALRFMGLDDAVRKCEAFDKDYNRVVAPRMGTAESALTTDKNT